MDTKPELTIIISYYKALDNLKLILMGLDVQSRKGFEVLISEDDQNVETTDFVKENKDSYTFSIQHLNQQEDLGFRKNMMLNRSIRASRSDKLVFIDGDCIPHRHFVKQYLANFETGYILWGRRVMLGERASTEIIVQKSLKHLDLGNLIFSDSKKLKDGVYSPFFSLSIKEKGMKGCNWGIHKQHLVDINGYDEDYVGAGVGEDVDVEWRLKANGIRTKSMKNKAIVYHLYHARSYSNEGVELNVKMLRQKIAANRIRCINGLEKLPDNVPRGQ